MVSPHYWEMVNRRMRISSRLHNTVFASPISRIFYGITDRFFLADREKKILEIGCAPGHKLIEFAQRYGYQPYGVEYTISGVTAARKAFSRAGYAPEALFYADAFSDDFQRAHSQEFDAVMSFGFIEHFDNPHSAVAAHLNMVKPGGLLLIMIPNLRGIYYPLLRFLAPDILVLHNVEIMKKKVFHDLFRQCDMRELFCDYYGLLNFGLLQARGVWRQTLLKALWRIQFLCNPFISLARHPIFENAITSPYVLYIGRKK